MSYDHEAIAAWRERGQSWSWIARHIGKSPEAVRSSHRRWKERVEGRVVQEWRKTPEGTVHLKYPEPDLITPEEVEEIWAQAQKDFLLWRPRKTPPKIIKRSSGSPKLAVLNLYDSHFGMNAWGSETDSENQDLASISSEFDEISKELVGFSRSYDPERYLIPLGHDFSHVNQYDAGGKGGVTRAGTPQDVDSRLHKIFEATVRSSVHLIDLARSTGREVDVVMVPGNHDPDENFKLGMVLWAWYKDDPHVTITNTPTMHKYYGWGANTFMLTHGEHYKKRGGAGNPIVIFSAECPADLWAASEGGVREILSGHFHKRMQGQYTPTSDVDEERRIVTRSLPGLTATDQWHYSKGYEHRRAATLLVYGKEGVMRGLHEFKP